MDITLEKGSHVTSILVPVKGRSTDLEVMRQATLLAKRNKAKLCAVYVIVVKQELALDSSLPAEMAKGEEVLEAAAKVASEYGVPLETSILQARTAAVAIVEEAVERGADVMMLAVTYRDRFGEFNMGKTVPYVLKNAPCRVWIYRDELKRAHEHRA